MKSGRRMTHTAVRKPTLRTRDALYDTREHGTVLPYGRRVMLSDHQPGRDIS